MPIRLSSRRTHLAQHLHHIVSLQLPGRFLACQEQVEQIVVGQVHQGQQALGLVFVQRRRMAQEKTLDEQVVLEQAAGMEALMDLSDNDLLDLLLRRKEPEGELLRGDVVQVLRMMRTPQ